MAKQAHIVPTEGSSPRFVALIAAANYAGVPVSTLRHYVRTGQIPAYRLGKRLLQIDLNDIDQLRRRVRTVTPVKAKNSA